MYILKQLSEFTILGIHISSKTLLFSTFFFTPESSNIGRKFPQKLRSIPMDLFIFIVKLSCTSCRQMFKFEVEQISLLGLPEKLRCIILQNELYKSIQFP